MLLAYKLLKVIVDLLPQFSFPHEAAIAINVPVLIFCVAVSLLTGIFFGHSPALRLSRPDVREAMQSGTRTEAGKTGSTSMHKALIAGQIALKLLLLSAAGEAIQGFVRMSHVHLGYDPHNVMSVGLPVRPANHTDIAARAAFVEQLRDNIAHVNGVQAAAVSSNATPPDNGFSVSTGILGQPKSEDRIARANLVSEGYFPLLRIPLLQGRLWTADESYNAAKVAVINETMARKYFPGGDALSNSISFPVFKPQPPDVVTVQGADSWLQIIGVVADKLDSGLSKPVAPEAYIPFTLAMGTYTQVLVRTEGPPLALLHTIGVQVATVDHDQQISGQVRDLALDQHTARVCAWLADLLAVRRLSPHSRWCWRLSVPPPPANFCPY